MYQWVAVGSESSGVISMTSSDNEEEYEDARKGRDSAYGDPSAAAAASSNAHTSADNPGGYQQQQQNQRSDRDSADSHYQQDYDQWHAKQPMQIDHPSYSYSSVSRPMGGSSRWNDELDPEAEKKVHLLRESVASLLSSSGGSGASSVASAQASTSTGGLSRRNQRTGLRHRSQGPEYRPTRSPSSLSKISEPCYPPSAPRRKFAPNLDHFSDIALSSNTSPPFASVPRVSHQHQQMSTTQFPTYDEFKQLQQQQNQQHSVPAASPAVKDDLADKTTDDGFATRKRANTADTFDSFADVVAANTGFESNRRFVAHPLLADVESRLLVGESSLYSAATRSPFASIRTLSPVVVAEKEHQPSAELINKARAAAALEQTIHCPMRVLRKQSAGLVASQQNPLPSALVGADGSVSGSVADGTHGTSSGWARYTGYAIVGFGMGTLVGMLCLEMGATPAIPIPRATRSFPVAGA
ncbi:hypothetical protein IWW45_005307 [Coemansia sp. RSA 485]|nr:hypothetical protein IWW45_005307 [Coemansia sp. RSA 485]